jgi:hypothetical protein
MVLLKVANTDTTPGVLSTSNGGQETQMEAVDCCLLIANEHFFGYDRAKLII